MYLAHFNIDSDKFNQVVDSINCDLVITLRSNVNLVMIHVLLAVVQADVSLRAVRLIKMNKFYYLIGAPSLIARVYCT